MTESRHLWIWYTPFGIGGVERFLLEMCREAVRDGVSVAVAAVTSMEGPLRPEFEAAEVEIFDWTGFDAAFYRRGGEGITAKMAADLERFQPSAVFINDCIEFGAGSVPLLSAIRPHAVLIDTFHIDGPGEAYFRDRRAYLPLLDGIVGTNRRVLARFAEISTRRTIEHQYIRNGASVPDLPRPARSDRLRILYTGRLEERQKRVLEIPRVLSDLRRRGVSFEMTIAGDGPDAATLREAVGTAGLGPSVRLLGAVPPAEIPKLLASSDVWLSLSRYEGFSIAMIEAMALGCVPVMPNLASLDLTILREGEACRLFPVDEPLRAAEILAELTGEKLDRMSRAAKLEAKALSPRATWVGYRDFAADLAVKRPLEPWGKVAALPRAWDVAKNNPWIPHPHPIRRFIGRNLLDRPRYALRLRTPRLARLMGLPWQTLHNRGEKISKRQGQRGVVCDWKWTSSLFYCQLRPNAGLRLMRQALRDRPIRLSRVASVQPAKPLVSFVVGHRGAARIPHLEMTLKSLQGQRGVESEIVVVEQDSESLLAGRLPDGVRHLLTPPPTPGMPYSRSWAFNVGAREARGRIVVFHDNDVVAPADYAAELAQVFANGFVAARLQRFVFYLSAEHTARIFETKEIGADVAPERVEQNCEGHTVAVDRKTYFEIGGHDESFIGWGGEDNEFFDRLKAVRLHEASYLPFLHLWHPAAPGKWAANENTRRFNERSVLPREERIRDLAARPFG